MRCAAARQRRHVTAAQVPRQPAPAAAAIGAVVTRRGARTAVLRAGVRRLRCRVRRGALRGELTRLLPGVWCFQGAFPEEGRQEGRQGGGEAEGRRRARRRGQVEAQRRAARAAVAAARLGRDTKLRQRGLRPASIRTLYRWRVSRSSRKRLERCAAAEQMQHGRALTPQHVRSGGHGDVQMPPKLDSARTASCSSGWWRRAVCRGAG